MKGGHAGAVAMGLAGAVPAASGTRRRGFESDIQRGVAPQPRKCLADFLGHPRLRGGAIPGHRPRVHGSDTASAGKRSLSDAMGRCQRPCNMLLAAGVADLGRLSLA